MSEERIFSGNTVEEVAQAFAEEVTRDYLRHLEYWQATAVDDREEYRQWEIKIESEPEMMEKNAFDKILKIMQEPQENKQYFKKKWCFLRSKDVISITKSSGFYKDLLPGEDIEHAFPTNVEYLIDTKRLIAIKKIYSQYERL